MVGREESACEHVRRAAGMYGRSTEVTVGIFVILGAIGFLFLMMRLGGEQIVSDPHYRVNAVFSSVTGLRKGAPVEIAGVEVGRVLDIALDEYHANVSLGIRRGVRLSSDTIASVRTKGIIGDTFVKLSPGGSKETIAAGGVIVETEPAVSLEELLSRYIFESK